MVKIIRKQRLKEKEIVKPTKKFSLSEYHKELEKISTKFIGLTASKEIITDIVVEPDISESELKQLQTKLQELVENPDFGYIDVIQKKSVSERLLELESKVTQLEIKK